MWRVLCRLHLARWLLGAVGRVAVSARCGPLLARRKRALGCCHAPPGVSAGLLAIKAPWPSTIRGVVGDYDRYVATYFPIEGEDYGYYLTGDGCRRDEEGYYTITGRVEDVINTSGHRIGTAEVESAVVLHPDVAEAAVVGFPHPIKGEGIYIYVTLNEGVDSSDELYQVRMGKEGEG